MAGQRFVVDAVDALPPGTRRRVTIAGRALVIFNVDGSFHALRDRCPHQGAPLSEGPLVGAVSSQMPGEYDYDPDRTFVKCPWHGWEFDLQTGESWFDPRRQRVKAYPVCLMTGDDVRARGPFVADTIPVVVEGEYVLVEL